MQRAIWGFLLRHVELLIHKSELEKVPDVPVVVLASMASLEDN